jgi:hypothetical protein
MKIAEICRMVLRSQTLKHKFSEEIAVSIFRLE